MYSIGFLFATNLRSNRSAPKNVGRRTPNPRLPGRRPPSEGEEFLLMIVALAVFALLVLIAAPMADAGLTYARAILENWLPPP